MPTIEIVVSIVLHNIKYGRGAGNWTQCLSVPNEACYRYTTPRSVDNIIYSTIRPVNWIEPVVTD